MKKADKYLLLENFRKEKKEAFNGEYPNVQKLKLLVSSLNGIDKEDKPFFKDFVNDLKKELFKNNIKIKGLDIVLFDKEIEEKENKKQSIQEKKDFSIAQKEFKELLNSFINDLKSYLECFKNYFIIKYENDPTKNYNLIILYDNDINFYVKPIKQKIKTSLPEVKVIKIEEFKKEIEQGTINGNYLSLLLLSSKANDGESLKKIKDDINLICNSFTSVNYYCFKDFNETFTPKFSNVIEDLINEIEWVTETVLSNNELSHEEEKIIKKLFKYSHTPLLIYKIIKSGKSGAKVVEIVPKKEFAEHHEQHFIIKFGEKAGKIKKEAERFAKWIDGYKGFNEYNCRYDYTLTHEGIRYTYAITPDEDYSYSFAKILNDERNKFKDQITKIINDLYDIRLFQVWSDSKKKENIIIKKLYEDYINPQEIFDEIKKIKDLTETELEKETLIINFDKVWDSNIDTYVKVCHGDLHSENFFYDGKNLYLIDFGFTDQRHSIIDYTTLECSIKFRHIPFYININTLKELEEELLKDDTFLMTYNFKSTQRDDLLRYFDFIKIIRNKSLSLLLNPSSRLEYFVSLFIITFRQIKFKDLNQLYVLQSAELLSKKIVQLMSL